MMQQLVTNSFDHTQILREVLDELSSDDDIKRVLQIREESIRHLRPVLAYACRLHLRAGCTAESKAALKHFAYCYLRGQIPHFVNTK
ncbi:MAG: hypothetical protein ACFFDP_12230 [Promethearchaeota archaeon]